jgi:hypothetical protein
MLRQADRTLDDWFRQSRMTTQQASAAFERFLGRARRDGAGALRQQLDSLQVGLGKLSGKLRQIEKTPGRKTSRRPSTARSRRPQAKKRTKAA